MTGGALRMRAISLVVAVVVVAGGVAGFSSGRADASGGVWTKSRCERTIRTGVGYKPGTALARHPMTGKQRTYALRLFLAGPYRLPAMDLVYGVDAEGMHFAPKSARDKFLGAWKLVGAAALEDQIAALKKTAVEAAWYGLTVRQVAVAVVRGGIAGALD